MRIGSIFALQINTEASSLRPHDMETQTTSLTGSKIMLVAAACTLPLMPLRVRNKTIGFRVSKSHPSISLPRGSFSKTQLWLLKEYPNERIPDSLGTQIRESPEPTQYRSDHRVCIDRYWSLASQSGTTASGYLSINNRCQDVSNDLYPECNVLQD